MISLLIVHSSATSEVLKACGSHRPCGGVRRTSNPGPRGEATACLMGRLAPSVPSNSIVKKCRAVWLLEKISLPEVVLVGTYLPSSMQFWRWDVMVPVLEAWPRSRGPPIHRTREAVTILRRKSRAEQRTRGGYRGQSDEQSNRSIWIVKNEFPLWDPHLVS
jgi:hypothetical protein